MACNSGSTRFISASLIAMATGFLITDGYPDQTYDELGGPRDSAYSGSLWLASLRAAEELAKELATRKRRRTTTNCLPGQKSISRIVERDVLPLRHGERIQKITSRRISSRVSGYADMTGLGDIVPRRKCAASAEKHLRQQRNEICERRNGRGEWRPRQTAR